MEILSLTIDVGQPHDRKLRRQGYAQQPLRPDDNRKTSIENYESTGRHWHRRQTHLNWLATRLGHGNRLGVLALNEPIVG